MRNCLKLHLIAITNSKFKKSTISDMHYSIRYMHVKYQLNRDKRFVKTVNTKNNLNCIKLQLAIQISKNCFFQTCITESPIIGPNLRSIGMLVILQPRSKDISADAYGQTDGRTDRHRE